MAKTQRIAARSARLRFGFLLLAVILTSASIASAQYPLQYPSKSQVSKDGTQSCWRTMPIRRFPA